MGIVRKGKAVGVHVRFIVYARQCSIPFGLFDRRIIPTMRLSVKSRWGQVHGQAGAPHALVDLQDACQWCIIQAANQVNRVPPALAGSGPSVTEAAAAAST